MSQKLDSEIAVIGIDIGKNSFHLVGQDRRGSIVLRQKWSRGQVEARLANLQPCLIGMEACVGAHHLSRNSHWPRPMILCINAQAAPGTWPKASDEADGTGRPQPGFVDYREDIGEPS